MSSLAESLSDAEIEIVRRALRAAVEGSFFPDWEFPILIGLERDEVRQVYEGWPLQTLDSGDFQNAVVGSLNNLLGYPHGQDQELAKYVPEGRGALAKILDRLPRL